MPVTCSGGGACHGCGSMIRDIFGGIWVVVDGCDLDESTCLLKPLVSYRDSLSILYYGGDA